MMETKAREVLNRWKAALLQQWRVLLGLLLLGLLAWSVAYQSRQPISIDIGSNYDGPFLVKYYWLGSEQDNQPPYRWAGPYSVIRFPGVGTGAATVHLQLSAAGSKRLPLPVQAYVNGGPAGTLNVTAADAGYDIVAPFYPLLWGGDGGSSGDLLLVLQAEANPRPGDPRPGAFRASKASLNWGGGLIIPPPFQLFWLGLSLVLLYALLRRLSVSVRWAATGGLGFIVATTLMLVFTRLLLTVYTDRLAAVLIVIHLALSLAMWLSALLFRRAGLNISPRLTTLLAALFAAGFALKLGGLFHPLSTVIDAEFHLARIREVAQDFWRYYSPPGLALAVMPKTDWKTQVIIPYSPFFYMLSRPLAWLPLPLDLTVYSFSALLDALRVYPVAFIALRFGWGERAAGYAALLAAFTPATFLLQQWGNWPTSFSLIFALIFLAVLVGYWPNLHRRALLWLTLMLTLVFLSYTVTAVFLGLTLLGLVLLGGGMEMLRRTSRPPLYGLVAAPALPPAMRPAYAKMALVLLAASLLATMLFYGQYIIVLVTETLPNILNATSQGSLKPTTYTWPDYVAVSFQTMVNYSLWPIYLLGIAGIVGILLRERGEFASFSKALLLSTLLVGLLFVAVNYYADMALKQYWWALPILALGGGWLLALADNRGAAISTTFASRAMRMLPALVCAGFVVNSLLLWFSRLFLHNR